MQQQELNIPAAERQVCWVSGRLSLHADHMHRAHVGSIAQISGASLVMHGVSSPWQGAVTAEPG